MLALVSWLIPYGVLDDVFAENSFLTVKIVSEFSQNLKQATNIPSLETKLVSFENVFYLLLLSGLILFLVDIIRYKQKTRKVRLRSKYLYETKSIPVFLIPDSDEIFTVGFLKPKIFVGEKYTKLKEFESIILHETQHVLHKDSLWLKASENMDLITFANSHYFYSKGYVVESACFITGETKQRIH